MVRVEILYSVLKGLPTRENVAVTLIGYLRTSAGSLSLIKQSCRQSPTPPRAFTAADGDHEGSGAEPVQGFLAGVRGPLCLKKKAPPKQGQVWGGSLPRRKIDRFRQNRTPTPARRTHFSVEKRPRGSIGSWIMVAWPLFRGVGCPAAIPHS
jgi:hypothetical protein